MSRRAIVALVLASLVASCATETAELAANTPTHARRVSAAARERRDGQRPGPADPPETAPVRDPELSRPACFTNRSVEDDSGCFASTLECRRQRELRRPLAAKHEVPFDPSECVRSDSRPRIRHR